MRAVRLGVALLATSVSLLATHAVRAGNCKLNRLPDIPVTMRGLKPTVRAQINGVDALFIADSGAFFNLVTPAAVREFHLRLDPGRNLYVEGAGGAERAQLAWAKTFTLMGHPVANVPFIVAGGDFGAGTIGLLGQNFWRLADVEYDLANGVIRLVRPEDCKGTPLAYWARAAGKPYSVIDIESASQRDPHTKAVAYLNGSKIRVLFDTGAAVSMLTLDAAKRAGISPNSPGVEAGGPVTGLGRKIPNTWIARFASFKIGDEEIDNARLRFGELDLLDNDLLIGADFFLSHRIYVATSQSRLYFTYNGGPVFDLTAQIATETPAPAAASGAAATAAAGDLPTDAPGYARRAAASAARNDYPSAIADLTRACELAPTEASWFYQRGRLYWHGKQLDAARADFDRAITLEPDDVDARLARAALHAALHQAEAAAQDLEVADRAAAKESDAQLAIAAVYEAIDQPAAAIVHYSRWIDLHARENSRMPAALNGRCFARALVGTGLTQALVDCNAAMKMRPNTAAFLGSRGLVYLRQDELGKAIADYDAALRLRPHAAWSLYGRGLAKLRQDQSVEGQADLAAAIALEPLIAERAGKFGLHP